MTEFASVSNFDLYADCILEIAIRADFNYVKDWIQTCKSMNALKLWTTAFAYRFPRAKYIKYWTGPENYLVQKKQARGKKSFAIVVNPYHGEVARELYEFSPMLEGLIHCIRTGEEEDCNELLEFNIKNRFVVIHVQTTVDYETNSRVVCCRGSKKRALLFASNHQTKKYTDQNKHTNVKKFSYFIIDLKEFIPIFWSVTSPCPRKCDSQTYGLQTYSSRTYGSRRHILLLKGSPTKLIQFQSIIDKK